LADFLFEISKERDDNFVFALIMIIEIAGANPDDRGDIDGTDGGLAFIIEESRRIFSLVLLRPATYFFGAAFLVVFLVVVRFVAARFFAGVLRADFLGSNKARILSSLASTAAKRSS